MCKAILCFNTMAWHFYDTVLKAGQVTAMCEGFNIFSQLSIIANLRNTARERETESVRACVELNILNMARCI